MKSIFLKGVSPWNLYNNYNDKKYIGINIESIRGVKAELNSCLSSVSLAGTDQYSDIYKVKNSNIYATTNCEIFNSYTLDREYLGRCDYCRQKIETMYGIPHKKETIDKVTVYHLVSYHCSLPCCYSSLFQDLNSRKFVKDYSEQNEIYLNELSFLFIGKIPDPANDWRLLKENGGPLNTDEYRNENYEYRRTHNVVLLPAKVVYERIKRL